MSSVTNLSYELFLISTEFLNVSKSKCELIQMFNLFPPALKPPTNPATPSTPREPLGGKEQVPFVPVNNKEILDLDLLILI